MLKWLKQRAQLRLLDKKGREAWAEVEREAKEEARMARLREVLQEVQKEMADAGFLPIKRFRYNKGSGQACSFAVGPDKQLYRITGFIGGGYDIEKV